MNIFNFYHFAVAFDSNVSFFLFLSFSHTHSNAITYYLLFALAILLSFSLFFFSFFFFLCLLHTNDRIRFDASHLFDADILFAFKLFWCDWFVFFTPPCRKQRAVSTDTLYSHRSGRTKIAREKRKAKKRKEEKKKSTSRRWYIACVWKWNIFIKMKMGKHACDMREQAATECRVPSHNDDDCDACWSVIVY